MRLALQVKYYAQHWCLRASMITLLAVFFSSLPSSCVANENHLACLNDAKDDEAALSVCIDKMHKRCYLAGDDLFDYPPQTACFKDYSVSVLEVAKDLRDRLARDPTVTGVMLKDAALRHKIRVGDADCDYLDETSRRDSAYLPGQKEMYNARCYASMHSVAFWAIIVNDRLR